MKTGSLITASFLLFFIAIATAFADFHVLEPGYKAELYASFASTSISHEMIFDSEGNLYIAQGDNNSITKITKNKTVIQSWVSGLSKPAGMEYTNGTGYGNNLYVACIGNGKVVKIDMNGNKTDFCYLNGATTLGYDNTGYYGNKLYVETSSSDRIYSASTTGSTSVFCNSFYDLSGCLQGIDFANSATYGNGMYIGAWYPYNTDKSGIFKIGTDGTAVKFCTNLVAGFSVNYDDIGLFSGDVFADGMANWSSGWGLYRISSTGIATPFIETVSTAAFTFDSSGAMYILDRNSIGSNVYKITPIPEPASLVLLGLGLIWFRNK